MRLVRTPGPKFSSSRENSLSHLMCLLMMQLLNCTYRDFAMETFLTSLCQKNRMHSIGCMKWMCWNSTENQLMEKRNMFPSFLHINNVCVLGRRGLQHSFHESDINDMNSTLPLQTEFIFLKKIPSNSFHLIIGS